MAPGIEPLSLISLGSRTSMTMRFFLASIFFFSSGMGIRSAAIWPDDTLVGVHMSEEDRKYPVLQGIASRVTQKQPDEIRLISAAEHRWSNPAGIESHLTTLHALGFANAGIYTI